MARNRKKRSHLMNFGDGSGFFKKKKYFKRFRKKRR